MSDQTEPAVELQQPDEARPAKRARLDAPLSVTEDTQHEVMDDDDWDDIYGAAADTVPAEQNTTANVTTTTDIVPAAQEGPTCTAPTELHEHQFGVTTKTEESREVEVGDGVPAEAIADGDDLVAPPPQPSLDNNDMEAVKIMEETTEVEYQPPVDNHTSDLDMRTAEPVEMKTAAQNPEVHSNDLAMLDARPPSKPTEDTEFMAAAAAQKGNEKAEWQFDSSDAESSSDSDTSDSSDDSSDESDSGSEGGYEMLDPATAAKILMSGDGDDDEGGKGKDKNSGDNQPRTVNEVKEELAPRPDVTITPDMQITHLGDVESVVGNMILIKGATPGEYQVLEGGSVLCNEKREVVGAVADTFGRVQEPLYSVAFNNAEEIEQAGLAYGTKVYYVNDHSTFVFTQPLKVMKGTDASNIHDEEVGEDEQEFSDDEAEAEYKRQRKLAKKAGRGGLSRSAFQSGARTSDAPVHDTREAFAPGSASDVPYQTYGGGLSYDDDEPAEDFYQPLKRPENLSQMMAGGPPPRPPPQSVERGRGRGRGDRGRGRSDRGRGRGGFDNRNQRGGRGGSQNPNNGSRGGHNQKGNQHRGNAHSFPDRHNDRPEHTLPPKPNVPVPASPSVQMPTPSPQPYYQQQAPQTYQFNGYTFQYGNPPPQQAPAPQYNYYAEQQQAQPAGQMPAGAHANPAYYQQQAQQQPAPPAYGAWAGQQYQQQYQLPQAQQHHAQTQQQYGQPHASAGAGAGASQAQQQQAPQPTFNIDLSGILKRLGAQ